MPAPLFRRVLTHTIFSICSQLKTSIANTLETSIGVYAPAIFTKNTILDALIYI